MTQNIQKRSFLVLSATRWTCGRSVIYLFFADGTHESVGKKFFLIFFFAQRLKKKIASSLMGRSGNRKQDNFFFFFFFFTP